MARTEQAQLNIRSTFARARVNELTAETGMNATQVVEEALRAYAPAPSAPVGSLVRRGPLLVCSGSGASVSFEEAEAALEAVRDRDP